MISEFDKKNLIKRFPDVKLFYEKKLHRKVFSNIFMIIPKGLKCFMWITYLNNKNICILLTLNNFGSISRIEQFNFCFDDSLAYGTLFYGTKLTIDNNTYFACEDIYYYKNNDISNLNFEKKLELLYTIFSNKVLNKKIKNFITFLLSPIFLNYQHAVKTISELPYDVYSIKYINTNLNNYIVGCEKYLKHNITEAIFKIKASIQQDIYYLFCKNGENKDCFYNVASISNYKNSVFMNTLFRKIKENENLDLLEESDSDSDFEDISEDKYVDLNKSYIIKCFYNKKFNKWEPKELLSDKTKISFYNSIKKLENY